MYCPSGQMDKASVSGAEDCGFESHLGCFSTLRPLFLVLGRCARAASTAAGACSVMVIIGASQALDPGSIPGRRSTSGNFSTGALAQSEECVLCKHEVRGSKPRCSSCLMFYVMFCVFSSGSLGRTAGNQPNQLW